MQPRRWGWLEPLACVLVLLAACWRGATADGGPTPLWPWLLLGLTWPRARSRDEAPEATPGGPLPQVAAALSKVRQGLVGGHEPHRAAALVVEELGPALGARRAILLRRVERADRPASLQTLAAWQAAGTAAEQPWPALLSQGYADAGLGRWQELLRAGQVVHSAHAELPEYERRLPPLQVPGAVLAVPLSGASGWWGHLQFDFAAAEVCGPAVVQLVEAGAGLLEAHLSRLTAQREQQATERRFRAVTEVTGDAIGWFDSHGRLAYCNAAASRLLSLPLDSLVGRPAAEFDLPEPFKREVLEAVREVIRSGEPSRLEVAIPSGEVVDWALYPEYAPDGSVRQVLSSARDMTALRSAEHAVGRRDAILATVAASTRLLLAADSWQECIAEVLRDVGQSTGSSRVYIFENSVAADGELLMSQRFEWVDDGVRVELDNPELQNLPYQAGGFGRWVQVLGNGAMVRGHVADLPESERPILESQGIRSILVVPIQAHSRWWGFIGFDECRGQRAFSHTEASALLSLAATIGTAMERQDVEEALRERETWTRTLLDRVQTGILVIDAETHRVVDANPVAEALTGRERGDLVGRLYHDVVCPAERGQCPVTDLGHPCENAERTLLQLDGNPISVIKTVVPVTLQGRTYLLESFVDITARKAAEAALLEAQSQLEERVRQRTAALEEANQQLRQEVVERQRAAAALRQSEDELRETNIRLSEALRELESRHQRSAAEERLRALGTMAGGIAHDFNNALAPVVGFSELLLQPHGLNDQVRARELLELIRSAAEQSAAVVRRLRDFYRGRSEQSDTRPVALAEVLQQAVTMATPGWKTQAQAAGVTIRVDLLLDPVPPVVGNADELRQAVINLILNAADAIIARADSEVANGLIGVCCKVTAGAVVVEVSDNGAGMTEEVRRRCLEPFYTTKGEHGSGLGLALVYGTAQRHGATFEIESSFGQGSRFRIGFPARAPAATAPAGPSAPRSAGRLHALVADDEPMLRQMLAAFLEAEGHTCDLAGNGHEAWELFCTRRYDVVLTDRAMPDMNGDQLAAAVKSRSPGTPVVLVTGFGDLMEASGEHPKGVDAVVGKPVRLAHLNAALAQVRPRPG
ncbi:MAG: PAS domain S-box protein [Fimbriimonadaceae bacterium]|nr:PAS domain S-box protein [Fimbriimonadaceae bacterium]